MSKYENILGFNSMIFKKNTLARGCLFIRLLSGLVMDDRNDNIRFNNILSHRKILYSIKQNSKLIYLIDYPMII